MIAVSLPRASTSPRWHHLLQFTAVVALLGSFQLVMSPGEVAGSGVAPKSFLLLRMAFLVLLCTWFLRRGGERWADVGLRRPPRWWTVPVLVAAGFLLLIVVSGVM